MDEGKQISSRLPALRLIVECGSSNHYLSAKAGMDVLFCKLLCVIEEVSLNEIGGEVADRVFSDAVPDEAQLFKVASSGYALLTEAGEQQVKIAIKRPCELAAQAPPSVSDLTVAKPILFDFREYVPTVKQSSRCALVC